MVKLNCMEKPLAEDIEEACGYVWDSVHMALAEGGNYWLDDSPEDCDDGMGYRQWCESVGIEYE